MSSKKLNKNWLHDHLNDPYVKLAQKEGYRARAAYKLKEIDETDHLIHPGQVIVDLGAAPGSWAQYVRRTLVGKEGRVLGTIIALDCLAMEPIADVHFIQGDFLEESSLRQLETLLAGRQVDLVLSDMAPNLSGIRLSDTARAEALVDVAIDFAQKHLQPQGALLAKCFHGASYNDVLATFRRTFHTVLTRKPHASRDKSSEVFLLGKHLKT